MAHRWIGAVAQLGERRVRNAEVRGSTPLGSTSVFEIRRQAGGRFHGGPLLPRPAPRAPFAVAACLAGERHDIDARGEQGLDLRRRHLASAGSAIGRAVAEQEFRESFPEGANARPHDPWAPLRLFPSIAGTSPGVSRPSAPQNRGLRPSVATSCTRTATRPHRIIFILRKPGAGARGSGNTNGRRPMGSISAASRRMIAGYAPPDAGCLLCLQSVCQTARASAPQNLGCRESLTTK